MMDASSEPMTIGKIMSPDSVGLYPLASCMYCARKTDAPNCAIPMGMEAITVRAKVLSLKKCSGISGSLLQSVNQSVAIVNSMSEAAARL